MTSQFLHMCQNCKDALLSCSTKPFTMPSLYLQRGNKVGQEYDIHVHHTPNTIQQTGEHIKKYNFTQDC